MKKEIKDTNRKRKTSIIKNVVSGNVLFNKRLLKQRWYILYLFGLAILYIFLHYYKEHTIGEFKNLENELNSLTIEYTIRSSELMRLSKRSEVEQAIKTRGMTLRPPQRPPKRIKMD